MEGETHIYSTETLISQATNKPVSSADITSKTTPIFWCETCKLKLLHPVTAAQHFLATAHKQRVASNQHCYQNASKELKRKTSVNQLEQPFLKKDKVELAEKFLHDVEKSLVCNDCNLAFTSLPISNQHFSGKKHASVIAMKLTSTKVATAPNKTNFCPACNIALNSEGQLKQHNNGVRHKLNVGVVADSPGWWVDQQKVFDETTTKRSSGKGVGETYRCDICALELNSEFQYGQHMTSPKHKAKEQSLQKQANSIRETANRSKARGRADRPWSGGGHAGGPRGYFSWRDSYQGRVGHEGRAGYVTRKYGRTYPAQQGCGLGGHPSMGREIVKGGYVGGRVMRGSFGYPTFSQHADQDFPPKW